MWQAREEWEEEKRRKKKKDDKRQRPVRSHPHPYPSLFFFYPYRRRDTGLGSRTDRAVLRDDGLGVLRRSDDSNKKTDRRGAVLRASVVDTKKKAWLFA